MEKNGTNQLGITLGYDAKLSSTGNLFVCEVRTQIHTHTHTPIHHSYIDTTNTIPTTTSSVPC